MRPTHWLSIAQARRTSMQVDAQLRNQGLKVSRRMDASCSCILLLHACRDAPCEPTLDALFAAATAPAASGAPRCTCLVIDCLSTLIQRHGLSHALHLLHRLQTSPAVSSILVLLHEVGWGALQPGRQGQAGQMKKHNTYTLRATQPLVEPRKRGCSAFKPCPPHPLRVSALPATSATAAAGAAASAAAAWLAGCRTFTTRTWHRPCSSWPVQSWHCPPSPRCRRRSWSASWGGRCLGAWASAIAAEQVGATLCPKR